METNRSEAARIARALSRQLEALKGWGVEVLPVSARKPRPSVSPEPRPPGRVEAAQGVESPGSGRAVSPAGAPARAGVGSKAEALGAIARDVAACTRCALCKSRTHPVPGEGDPDATLVFVGEAPGREEDLQGRPFVGAAGQLLTRMIEAMALSRERVFICNVLKDRPPDNRTPLPEELAACLPFLVAQLDAIRPRVICALGAVSARALLGQPVSIIDVRGRRFAFRGISLIPTFHPAYLLRNPSAKKLAWEDLKKIKALLEHDEGQGAGDAGRGKAG